MGRLFARELFETKRQLEYFSEQQLSMQLGAEPGRWGLVLIKELVDNALDACEMAGILPEITVTLSPDGFAVHDNGPGMSHDLIQRSLNYDVRVSDKTYYVSPSRGQLGNALKCVWAAPYASDPESPGSVEVVSLGLQHRIAVTVNRIAQEPTLTHTMTERPFVENGASVTVIAPKVACYPEWDDIEDFYKSVEQLVETYVAFNPHATFHLQTPEGCLDALATTPDWRKWLPSYKTSPYWYETEHLTALIAAYLFRERTPGVKMKTLREFVSEFDGLSMSAKQKAALEAAALSRAHLRDLVEEDDLCATDVTRLLHAMQAEARPVNPKKLGVLGKAHLLQIMSQRHQIDTQKFFYKNVYGEASGLPCVLEVAFGVASQGCYDQERRVLAGINWSVTPPPGQPFPQLEQYLNSALVSRDASVMVVAHLAIPRPTFRDRGKQIIALPRAIENTLCASIESVTQRWTAAVKRAYRSHRAEARAEEEMQKQERAQYPSILEAAYELMPQGYALASGQGRYVAHARQVMYAIRRQILAMIHPD